MHRQITITKSTTSNLDTYNIVFDNAKLQIMLKNKLINQDVYNIWQNVNASKILIMKANAMINIPILNNSNLQVKAFQSEFYIVNNKFHFVDKDHQNPYKIDFTKLKIKYNKINNLNDFDGSDFYNEIDSWFESEYMTVEEHDIIISKIDSWFFEGYDVSQTAQMLTNEIFEIIATEARADWLAGLLAWFIFVGIDSLKTNIVQEIVNNFNKIKSADKYHTGVYETFYFFGLYMDPNSIKPVPPMTKSNEINDNLEAHSTKRDEIITREYDNDPLDNYAGFDSLWQYLNTDGQTFNLNKIFQSYVGILGQYNNWNYTFHHLESTAILKQYLNTWVTLTKVSWTNNNSETLLAQIKMIISDNPWTKTMEFNFKSILCNINMYDSVGNEMYY